MICNLCEVDQPSENFSKHRRQCKKCCYERSRKWAVENKEATLGYQRRFAKKNRDRVSKEKRQHYRDNKEKYQERQRRWNSENRDKLREYWDKANKQFGRKIRSRVSKSLQRNDKQSSTEELLGCSIPELRAHLESQFTEGMSWDNYGRPIKDDYLSGWHIDHIRPMSSFDLDDAEQQKQCWHYSNLQPLWAKDNLSKGCFWQDQDI